MSKIIFNLEKNKIYDIVLKQTSDSYMSLYFDEVIPNREILESGFNIVNEHNGLIISDRTNYNHVYKKIDEKSVILSNDGSEYVEPIKPIEPAEGDESNNTIYALTSLSKVGQHTIYPSNFVQGKWIWIGGQTSSASGTYSADIELIDFDENNLTNKFIEKTCSIENPSYRTLSIDNNMALIFHRTQTLNCCATWWSEYGIDLTNYSSIIFEITMDQAGDGSFGYNNYVGINKGYPGMIDNSGLDVIEYPIENYDIDYANSIMLGNSIFSRKSFTLDISAVTGTYFLKITAGNAGFIVHSIKLRK